MSQTNKTKIQTTTESELPKELRSIEVLSKIMDSSFRIPFTSFRFGLDPILGFVPVLGDLIAFSTSLFIIWTVFRHGVSSMVIVLMLRNLLIDLIMGSVPILGNIADFAYRANTKNLKLLDEYYREGKHQKGGKWVLIALLLAIVLVICFMLYLVWYLFSLVF